MVRNSEWVFFMVFSLAACSPYEGMLFVEHTHVGADITLDPTDGPKPVKVDVGYDRGLTALVPRTQSGGPAGSVISKTDLDISFTGGSTTKNVFVSGKAAKNISREGRRVATLFGECVGESTELSRKKDAVLNKLDAYKDNSARLKELHEKAFPKVSALSRVFLSNEAMYKELRAFVKGICDQNRESKLTEIASSLNVTSS